MSACHVESRGRAARVLRSGRGLIGFLISIVVLLSVGCSPQSQGGGASGGKGKGAGGPVPVTIAKVAQRDVPVEIQVVGNVEAYSTITVKSQVTGQLNSVKFREGDFVSAGELLFALDRRPIEAQIRQAEATLAKNFAQAKQAEANLAKDQAQQKYLRAQSERYTKLTQEGIFSKDQDDLVQANFGAINEAIEADRAAIESARADAGATRADIENLKVQLSYTEIRSPISGRTGNLNVTKGNLVTANTTELMTINQVQPIYVTFAVPEARLSEIKQRMAGGRIEVFVTAQDGNPTPERGVVTFVDNSVDTHHGHDQGESDRAQRGAPVVAGTVSARHRKALDARQRGDGSESGGADRAGGPVRLRG